MNLKRDVSSILLEIDSYANPSERLEFVDQSYRELLKKEEGEMKGLIEKVSSLKDLDSREKKKLGSFNEKKLEDKWEREKGAYLKKSSKSTEEVVFKRLREIREGPGKGENSHLQSTQVQLSSIKSAIGCENCFEALLEKYCKKIGVENKEVLLDAFEQNRLVSNLLEITRNASSFVELEMEGFESLEHEGYKLVEKNPKDPWSEKCKEKALELFEREGYSLTPKTEFMVGIKGSKFLAPLYKSQVFYYSILGKKISGVLKENKKLEVKAKIPRQAAIFYGERPDLCFVNNLGIPETGQILRKYGELVSLKNRLFGIKYEETLMEIRLDEIAREKKEKGDQFLGEQYEHFLTIADRMGWDEEQTREEFLKVYGAPSIPQTRNMGLKSVVYK